MGSPTPICQKSVLRAINMKTAIEPESSYVIVTPVKDEERYIAQTLHSVVNQTLRPAHWVVVDDGSTDGTPAIIKEYAQNFDWISYLRIDRASERLLGSAEIRAFAIGYETIRQIAHDYVVKLDADLSLPSDYFEKMLSKFRDNSRLGVASGALREEVNGTWKVRVSPKYHAKGAAKMVRVACFQEIGGFPLSPGWDTVDEIKAWARGWETRHFQDIEFRHLKPEGSAAGSLRTNFFHGEIYYVCGGGVLFLGGKVLHRIFIERPVLLCGAMLLYGYLHAAVTRRPKLVSPQEARCYKRLLNRRIIERIAPKPILAWLK